MELYYLKNFVPASAPSHVLIAVCGASADVSPLLNKLLSFFECQRCGKCCKSHYQYVDLNKDEQIRFECDKLMFPCRYQSSIGECTTYETRPNGCRYYPYGIQKADNGPPELKDARFIIFNYHPDCRAMIPCLEKIKLYIQ